MHVCLVDQKLTWYVPAGVSQYGVKTYQEHQFSWEIDPTALTVTRDGASWPVLPLPL